MVFAKLSGMLMTKKHIIIFTKIVACLLLGILIGISPAIAQHHSGHSVHRKTVHRKINNKPVQYGVASFYSNKFNGHRMANGRTFDNKKMTAANNSLPLGTYVKVTNRSNGKWTIVTITDRLHYKNKRLVDLSQTAAKRLGFRKRGLAKVKMEVIPHQMAELAGLNLHDLQGPASGELAAY